MEGRPVSLDADGPTDVPYDAQRAKDFESIGGFEVIARTARDNPDKVAVDDGEDRLTYAQFLDRVYGLAERLDALTESSSIVASVVPNSVAATIIIMACALPAVSWCRSTRRIRANDSKRFFRKPAPASCCSPRTKSLIQASFRRVFQDLLSIRSHRPMRSKLRTVTIGMRLCLSVSRQGAPDDRRDLSQEGDTAASLAPVHRDVSPQFLGCGVGAGLAQHRRAA